MNEQKRNLIIIVIVVGVVVLTLSIYITVLWKDGIFTGGYSRKSEDEKSSNVKISASDIAKYTEASTENIESRVTSDYVEEVKKMLSLEDFNTIYEKTDDDFIEKNNLSENTIKDFLTKNGYLGDPIWLDRITFYEQDNVYVYRMKFIIDYKVKYINVIEYSPYQYTLDFNQDEVPSIDSLNYTVTIDDINFEITQYQKKEESIVFDVKVTNKSDKRIKFDFTSVNSVGLKLENGDVIKQPTSILESGSDYSLTKDSYFIKRFYFPINMQYHKDIDGINFYNVKIENTEKNIYVRF